MFANPTGFLALLAIPALLAIHFLRRKSVVLPISTLFLLERTQRDAISGRRFERLVPSIPLWMQILSILLLAWFLAEPRFQKESSVQRIIVVVDSSASMTAFTQRAIKSMQEKLPDLKGRASALELTLIPSLPGGDRLYSGSSPAGLIAALAGYSPHLGVIDPSLALRLARSIVSDRGIVLYLTDHPAERLPYGAKILSVGEKIDNVGFTDLTFSEAGGVITWHTMIRNYGDAPAQRSWFLDSSAGASAPEDIVIDPKSMVAIQGEFPKNADHIRLSLTPDRFPLDDILPMVIPRPKTLNIHSSTSPFVLDLAGKLIRALPAARSGTTDSSDLKISAYNPLDPTPPLSNSVLFIENPNPVAPYLEGSIIAEAHPLMDGINWQALLARATPEIPRQQTDHVLLWQGNRPLIFLRVGAGVQSLFFNFDLRLSNATLQPAFIVLLHRFAESIRAAKVAPETLNLETNQPISIPSSGTTAIQTIAKVTDPSGKSLAPPATGFAPSQPGFFTLSTTAPPDHQPAAPVSGENQSSPLLTAAVHFADTREADFSACEPADFAEANLAPSADTHTAPDPLARLWLLAALAALLAAWHFTAAPARATGLA